MTTPVRHQYLQIKKQYPEAIVFFRLGDFYETFDEDAGIVAEICDIALTSRPIGKNQRVPLAGVPYHSADGYIARLVAAGYKVAIVEQVGGGVSSHLRSQMSRGAPERNAEESKTRGLVHREVVRVVTPGTVVEPALLDARRNNYLTAVVLEADRAGLAYADVSTGEFKATQMRDGVGYAKLQEELARLQPSEILICQSEPDSFVATVSNGDQSIATRFEDWHFAVETARQALLDQFGVATLDGFGLQGKPLAIRAAGAIVQYLEATQKSSLSNLTSLASYSTDHYMTLDAATRRNLELTQTIRSGSVNGSLLGVLDHTVTPMGARMLRGWIQQPLMVVESIDRRLEAVQLLVDNTPARKDLAASLKQVADLERLVNRAVQGIVRPRELLSLARSLMAVPHVKEILAEIIPGGATSSSPGDALPLMAQIQAGLDPCLDTVDLISSAIAEDPPAVPSAPGVIRRGFSEELDAVMTSARDAKAWVANLEQSERKRLGIKNLKVSFNKVFGYYIEISKSNLSTVPPEYIRKQTLVNAERFITPELKEYEALILNAEERQADIEVRVFREVCDRVAAVSAQLAANAQAIAYLDACTSLAETAVLYGYVRPELSEDRLIEIKNGRHPVVEQLKVDGVVQPFVPNDVRLSGEELILVITGPNMSGKSTYLRQVALVVLMAQIGSFVPAERAHIGLVDRIFTRIGAEDIIHAGQSTFMVEMVETANILNHATSRSLLILDEIGRGTSTYDGLSIAWSVIEYIHNHPQLRARTLFATHYHELTDLADLLPKVLNYSVAVSEQGDQVVFLHKIIPGGADRSYGIHVAQLAGLPRAVVRRAEEILDRLESEASRSPLTPEHGGRLAKRSCVQQLPLFLPDTHPAVKALKELDVNSLTPLEAISKLYDLQHQVEADE